MGRTRHWERERADPQSLARSLGKTTRIEARMLPDRRQDTTLLLREAADGCKAALDRLVPLVYDELRELAAGSMQNEDRHHTLSPTELVHIAYDRLVDYDRADWKSRTHFMATAAKVMRQILIDHARAKHAQKRGGAWDRVALGDVTGSDALELSFLDLTQALTELSRLNQRHHDIIVNRYLGGLSVADVAQWMDLSPRTVERDTRVALAWLQSRLREDATGTHGPGRV